MPEIEVGGSIRSIVRSDPAIDELLVKAYKKVRAMKDLELSYHDGVIAGIEWVIDENAADPYRED